MPLLARMGALSAGGASNGLLPVDYLVAAGGGGGGSIVLASAGASGSGGAGGLLTGAFNLLRGAYAITVGTGGAVDNAGTNSTFNGLTCFGGGFGGAPVGNGGNGGSGGGGSNGGDGVTTTSGGTGVGGQGFGGKPGPSASQGFGGGAGGAGSATPGPGVASSISGASVTYCMGGDVFSNPPPPANTGQGGNAGSGPVSTQGLAGANGVVIIRYVGGAKATGGTITSSGGYTCHTFTTNGSFVVL
jgi:hypothetical protein